MNFLIIKHQSFIFVIVIRMFAQNFVLNFQPPSDLFNHMFDPTYPYLYIANCFNAIQNINTLLIYFILSPAQFSSIYPLIFLLPSYFIIYMYSIPVFGNECLLISFQPPSSIDFTNTKIIFKHDIYHFFNCCFLWIFLRSKFK